MRDDLVGIGIMVGILLFFGMVGYSLYGSMQRIRETEAKDCHTLCSGGQVEEKYRSSDRCLCPNEYGELILKKVY